MPRLLPDNIRKISAVMFLTEEQLFDSMSHRDSRYQRKAEYKTVEPTPEEWARYHEAKKAFDLLEAYDGMDWGIPESDPFVYEPSPKQEVTFLETNEEWLERCRQLQKEVA